MHAGDFYDIIMHAADVLGTDLVQMDCIDLKEAAAPLTRTPQLSRRDSGVEFEASPLQSQSDVSNSPKKVKHMKIEY